MFTMKFHYSEFIDNENNEFIDNEISLIVVTFNIKHLNFVKNQQSKQFSKIFEII